MYDVDNVFAKILRGEIPCKKIADSQYFLSFYDVDPKATVHALIIPTGAYINAHDFAEKASIDEQVGFWQGMNKTLEILQLKENGYRLIMNTGQHGRQEVEHFHMHILGGNDLGPKVVK